MRRKGDRARGSGIRERLRGLNPQTNAQMREWVKPANYYALYVAAVILCCFFLRRSARMFYLCVATPAGPAHNTHLGFGGDKDARKVF